MAGALAGRLALVTGASRGIGLACATALAHAGARVVMMARGRDALEAAAAPLDAAAIPLPCDVADPAALERALARVAAEAGAPDILVNNAGRFVVAPAGDTTPGEFTAVVTTNLVAPFAIVHALLPGMRRRGAGHVVTIGSVADRTIFPGNAAYAASKFGLRALHEVLHTELRGTGIRTTLVSPAAVDTPLWDPVAAGPGLPPRSAMLRPEAVAAAVLYAVTAPAEVNVDELRLSRR
jgi:NADP-dependent 3-hydroxy acid dehydrogenase YdfG